MYSCKVRRAISLFSTEIQDCNNNTNITTTKSINNYYTTPSIPKWECAYLLVEVEETFGAVDVMEGGERLDGAINAHGVKPHGSARGDQHPVRRRTTDEHLWQQGNVVIWFNREHVSLKSVVFFFLNGFLTPEYPEMSSKYLNLAVRLLTAALSSLAPLSAFLSFFSFDFFSLKLMLWGTWAEQSSKVKISLHSDVTWFSPSLLSVLPFWSALSGCFVAAADRTGTPHRSEAPVPHGPRKQGRLLSHALFILFGFF